MATDNTSIAGAIKVIDLFLKSIGGMCGNLDSSETRSEVPGKF
jgi:hypothetical protein